MLGEEAAGSGEEARRARGGGDGLGEEAAARARGGGGVEVGDDGLGGGGMLEKLNRLSGGRGKP